MSRIARALRRIAGIACIATGLLCEAALADPENALTATTSLSASATASPVTTVSVPALPPPSQRRIPPLMAPGQVGGIALILLGLAFFVMEAQATTHGAFAVAGVLCVIAGFAFIFGYTTLALSLSWSAIGPLVLLTLGVLVWTLVTGIRGMNEKPMDELKGQLVFAHGPLTPHGGKVEVDGILWNAVSTVNVPDGGEVRILEVKGLTLHVEPTGGKRP